MGQKTNPIILRMSNTTKYDYKYLEKKSSEQAQYDFNNLEIKKFLYQFFKINEMNVNACKINYSQEGILQIFISYYAVHGLKTFVKNLPEKPKLEVKKPKLEVKKPKLEVKKPKLEVKKPKLKVKKPKLKVKKLKLKVKKFKLSKKVINLYNLFNYIKKLKNIKKKVKRLYLLKRRLRQKYFNFFTLTDKFFLQKYKNLKQIESNYFLNSLCESLSKFLNKKIKIFLTLQQLNKNLVKRLDNKKIKILKKSLVKLNRYQQKRNPFFKEGLNTLFVCSQQQNSANLIAEFISTELKNLKRHNFFLKFIERCLITFKNNGYSKLEGLKIKIKGRINRRPRARHRFYKIGKEIPLLSINSKIYYAQKTSFTPNGTLGVKVWTI